MHYEQARVCAHGRVDAGLGYVHGQPAFVLAVAARLRASDILPLGILTRGQGEWTEESDVIALDKGVDAGRRDHIVDLGVLKPSDAAFSPNGACRLRPRLNA